MAPIKEAILLLLLTHAAATNKSYCGRNFGDAKSNCNAPCSHIGIDTENCPSGQWCFGPNLPCTLPPPGVDGSSGEPTTTSVVGSTAMDSNTSTSGKEVPSVATMMMMSGGNATTLLNSSSNTNNATNEPMMTQFMMLSSDPDSNTTTDRTPSPTTTANPTTMSPSSTSTTMNPTTASPTTSSPTSTASPTTLAPTTIGLAEERRGIDNPSNHYCGTGWDQAKNDCNNDINAIPCPQNLPCLTGQLCLAIGLLCRPVTVEPTPVPSVSPNTANPAGASPTMVPTTEQFRLAEERRGVNNPANHYCGTGWGQTKIDCNENINAIPCPANLPCLDGQLCFAMGFMCDPATFEPTLSPSESPTTAEPTTARPTSSPISAEDVSNTFFCGVDENDANANCSGRQWCRYGTDEECPEEQQCLVTTQCNATAMNYTSQPTEMPTNVPTTPLPTEDLNPGNRYCADSWRDANYDGECGVPCPGGSQLECSSGQFCYSNQISCIKTHKVGVSTSWCGATFEDMADTCHQECPNGTDEECPDGETCWGDSPCALLDSKREADEAMKAMLWCATSYKHLVEHCPKPCEGGTDDECGQDEDGNDMFCFSMSEEEQVCNTTGVGVKEPVDSDNLWCGNSWNHVLENCPKKCPDGADEECDAGMSCYDLTGNEPMICKTESFGVKKKGDPNQRFCGDTYNQMMEFCHMRCPNGDECPGSSVCYEESPCKMEGQSAPGFVKQDTTKMFCGNGYGEAALCGAPCPGGSNSECDSGQTCWADVECNTWAASAVTQQADETPVDESSNMVVEVTVEIEGDEADSELELQPAPESESEPQPAPKPAPEPQPQTELQSETESKPNPQPEPESKPKPSPPAESKPNPPPAPQPEPESKPNPPAPQPEPQPKPKPSPPAESKPNPPPAEESSNPPPAESSKPPPAESSNPPPAESSNPPPAESSNPPPAESSNPPPAESSNPPPTPSKPATEPKNEGNPFKDNASTSDPDLSSNVAVDNLRIALYGLTDLSAAHLLAWESLTATYVEDFYNKPSSTNDSIRDSVSDVTAEFDVTSLNISAAQRLLRAQKRRAQDSSAFLLTYSQTAEYSTEEDIKIEQVLQHPFQSPAKRAAYVEYLQTADPKLFGDVTSVSAVFLPEPLEPREIGSATTASSGGSSSSSSSNPASSPSVSNVSAASGGVYSKNFYCHNSGEACPSGECPDGDLCMFVPGSSNNTPIAPFSGNSAPSTNSAANLVSSVLDGSFVVPPPTPNNTPPSPPNPSSMNNPPSNPQPRPQPTPIVAPTPEISVTVSTSNASNNNNDPLPLSSATYGPAEVSTLQMTLYGISLRSAKEVFEWQYLTAIYEQSFYNDLPLSQDYIQNNVYAFATALEVTEVSYGDSSSAPSTTFVFKQTTKYNSIDPDIGMMAVVTQPFSTSEYRDAYVNFLKTSLLETFGVLNSVPSVAQTGSSNPSIPLAATLFCAARRPIDCVIAQPCENDSDCPSGQDCLIESRCAAGASQHQSDPVQVSTPAQQSALVPVQQSAPAQKPTPVQQSAPVPVPQSTSAQQSAPFHSACNLCRPNQVGINAAINFNGRLTNCAEAYDFMATNYDEGSTNCIGAQEALSGTCCQDQGIMSMNSQPTPSYPTPSSPSSPTKTGSQPTGPYTVTASSPSIPTTGSQPAAPGPSTPTTDDSPSSPTKITVTIALKENPNIAESLADSEPEMLYSSNTYYCGTSMETAANSCSIPCPSSEDDECPGNLQCFGNTECMNREFFYCGESWLDASDKCSKPCPNGDALECDEGEACFAWTSCENTESFYCGVSFEDASSNCALACPTRSSLDCPNGQGCFAYTTCEGEISPPHEVSPAHVPMNDNFCGDSKELASSTCSIACQGGLDSECPTGMQCHDGTGCSSRDSFWCGPTWMEAAEMCSQPCSSGSSDDCSSGESCYAHTGCQANLFFCGDTFADASESCNEPCESRSSIECSGDQLCFAFVTACASEANPFSPTSQPTSQSYSFGIANTQWDLDAAVEGKDSENSMGDGNQHGEPNWYTQWEVNSSSSLTRSASLILVTGIASFSLALALTTTAL